MKRLLSALVVFCLLLAVIPADVNAASKIPSSAPPSIPTSGDVWDGETTTKPTKLTSKDGVYYYQINTCAELAYLAQERGAWLTYNYILQNNLILNKTTIVWDDAGNCTNAYNLHEWTTIPTFCGIFDGNGFTISGMYINQPKKSNVGLFGLAGTQSSSATVKNLNVVNAFVTGDTNVGGLVGKYDIFWNDRNSIFFQLHVFRLRASIWQLCRWFSWFF